MEILTSIFKQRMGGSPHPGDPFPPGPKGMWHRTYERLWRRYLEAETHVDDAFYAGAARFR
jgi:hypothetical protein